jgi:hypothetical protein
MHDPGKADLHTGMVEFRGMTERLRSALAARQDLHQLLFYALCHDLNDLACPLRTPHKMVPVEEILDLVAEYAKAEEEAMKSQAQEMAEKKFQWSDPVLYEEDEPT